MYIYIYISPFGFPLRFEGAWVPYEAEKIAVLYRKMGLEP